jgi:hypothetical protein
VLGAWPTAPQADDRIPQGGTGEGGVAPARLVTDGGQPFAGPQTRWLATGARTLVQDDTSRLSCLSIEPGLDPKRHVRPTRHTCQATGVTRVEHVAPRVRRTAQGLRDPRGLLSLRACEPSLAAAPGEGIMTAQPSAEGSALFVCDVADIQWWFHSVEPITLHPTCTNTLLILH